MGLPCSYSHEQDPDLLFFMKISWVAFFILKISRIWQKWTKTKPAGDFNTFLQTVMRLPHSPLVCLPLSLHIGLQWPWNSPDPVILHASTTCPHCSIESHDPITHLSFLLSAPLYTTYRGQVSVCVCQIVCGATACYLSDSCLSPASCPSCLLSFITCLFVPMILDLEYCLYPNCQVPGPAFVHTSPTRHVTTSIFTERLYCVNCSILPWAMTLQC